MKTYISMDDQLTLRPCSCGGTPGVFINISGTQVYVGCPECGAKLVLADHRGKYRLLVQDVVAAMKVWNTEPEMFIHGLSTFHQPLIGNELLERAEKAEEDFIHFKNMHFMDEEDRIQKEQKRYRKQQDLLNNCLKAYISDDQKRYAITYEIMNGGTPLREEDKKDVINVIELTEEEAKLIEAVSKGGLKNVA